MINQQHLWHPVCKLGPSSWCLKRDLEGFFSLLLGSNLLESKADGIEVSYNACGVLSHIMFDGPEAWGICEPPRGEVEERMWAAIQSWDINSRRNINYRCGAERGGGRSVRVGSVGRQDARSQQGLSSRALSALAEGQPPHSTQVTHKAGRMFRAHQHLRVPKTCC